VEITVYWRPGCQFCSGLMRGLDRLDVAYGEVNIWEDPEGAAFVRRASGGDELVPTVRVGPEALLNPTVSDVLATVRRLDPDTTLPPPAEPGRLGRALWRLLRGSVASPPRSGDPRREGDTRA
jgi:mycoredoxin